jgi:hypothetical protein
MLWDRQRAGARGSIRVTRLRRTDSVKRNLVAYSHAEWSAGERVTGPYGARKA